MNGKRDERGRRGGKGSVPEKRRENGEKCGRVLAGAGATKGVIK